MDTVALTARRGFLLKSGAATAIAVGAAPSLAAAKALDAPDAPNPYGAQLKASDNACLRDVALADFRPLLGQPFQVYAPGHAAVLQLVNITPYPAKGAQRPQAARTEPFGLIFQAKHGAALQNGIHEFTHPTMGTLMLSLNELGAVASNTPMQYEVVFG
jgi:hypothetical protein